MDFHPGSAEGGNHRYRLGLPFSTHKLQLVSIGGWGTGWDNGRGCVGEVMALREMREMMAIHLLSDP